MKKILTIMLAVAFMFLTAPISTVSATEIDNTNIIQTTNEDGSSEDEILSDFEEPEEENIDDNQTPLAGGGLQSQETVYIWIVGSAIVAAGAIAYVYKRKTSEQ